MIVETLRMHKTWLTDVTHGAVAKIAAVPLEAGDAAPPALVDVVEETSDEATGGEGLPANPPCLGMLAEILADAPDPAMNDMGDGVIRVLLRYLTRQTNAAIARRDAAYSMRGILASLRLFAAGGQEASRSLRGVQLITRTQLTCETLYVPVGDGFCSGLITATYIYRDAGFLP